MKYLNVTIPEGKDTKKYTFIERRAEILRLILEARHPRAITQVQFAKRYGKSQAMIHKDFKKIAKEINKELGTDAKFITHVVFESTIMNLMKGNNRDKYNAAKLAKDWYEWLQGMGIKKKENE